MKAIKIGDYINDAGTTAKDAVVIGAAAVKGGVEGLQQAVDLQMLKPIFPSDLKDPSFTFSKLICIVDRDSKYVNKDACKGAIGFLSEKKGLKIVNIFMDAYQDSGLSFYQKADYGLYYVSPADDKKYITMGQYFMYLRDERINELQRVAQSLGASYFKVIYQEEEKKSAKKKDKVQVKLLHVAGANAEHDSGYNRIVESEVVSEMSMDPKAPQEPELSLLANDVNVRNLISLRMNGGEGFHSYKISIKLSDTTTIKVKDAIKIDALLKAMKIIGDFTIESEVKRANNQYLKYEVQFD